MSDDIVLALGHLALGTRLKRLGERLQAQTQAVLEDEGLALPASHFPVMEALARMGAANVGELATALGISQPGATRMLDRLSAAGMVESGAPVDDRRVRRLVLSPAGRQLLARARRRAWPRIGAAVADACAGAPVALLDSLAALERALADRPLRERPLASGSERH